MKFIAFCLFFLKFFHSVLSQTSLTNGLIACYPFNGSTNDASGNGNHTGKVSAVLVDDRFGRANSAYFFDGLTAYLEVNPNQLKINNFSVSLWAKVASLPIIGGFQYLWSVGSSNGEQSVYLSGSEGIVVGGSISDAEKIKCQSGFPPNTGNWNHIVMVRDINNLYFYLDGRLICSKPNIGFLPYYGNNFPRATFGRRVAGEASYFHGTLDDIHIYNRPLTALEIKNLYEGEKQPEIELKIDNLSPCGGDKVNFLVKGGLESANYLWKIEDFNKELYVNTFEFETKPRNQDYEIAISVEIIDNFSCFPQKPKKATDKIKVKVCSELVNLNIPNVFSPNNDGINDLWIIPNLERIPEATISVYNRAGGLVFQSKGYSQPWDGKLNGNVLSPDTFDYVISTKIKGEKAIKGEVLLVW